MSARTNSCLRIFVTASTMQWYVADILEAKAEEMETLRDWVLDTVRNSHVNDRNTFVAQSCEYHGQLVELLQGITRMESGLARHVQLLLEEQEVVPDNPFGTEDIAVGGGDV